MEKAILPGRQPNGYSAAQIILHWVIAALFIFQLLFGEDIKPAYRAFNRGTAPGPDDIFNANLHVYVGLAVLALAIVRLSLRLVQGVPPLPPGESVLQKRLAAGAHVLLYIFIFGMPATGALAWYFGIGAMGEVHETAKPFIIFVVALHALAALWQHFVLRSDVLIRMLKPAPRRL